MSKYNVWRHFYKTEPEFYDDTVYKFRKILGKNDFWYNLKRLPDNLYKKIC